MDDTVNQARAMVVTVLTVPVVTMPVVGLLPRPMAAVRARGVCHRRQHARNVTVQHVNNKYSGANANALQ